MPASPKPEAPSPRGLQRAVALLTGLVIGLAATVVFLLQRQPSGPELVAMALSSAEVRKEALAQLTAEGTGIWDSHPDADVGRILMANMPERDVRGVRLRSNAHGMRERDYALPKPEGMTRVVILGDSFVMGDGIQEDERFGRLLESELVSRGSAPGPVECIHLGLGSWNIRSEVSWLRRQLGLLKPDLVVHVLVTNDLDDTTAVRGFGQPAAFSAQFRERADGIILQRHPRILGFRDVGWLIYGLDHESTERYRNAAADLELLRDKVQEAGGRYLAVLHWTGLLGEARDLLVGGLAEEETAFLPESFDRDERFIFGPTNLHWNAAGNGEVMRLVYGLIQQRGLLPMLELEPWDEADQRVLELHEAGVAEAALGRGAPERLGRTPLQSEIVISELDDRTASQLHGGVGARGLLAPYASMLLACDENATALRLEGRCLPRPELDEPVLEVLVEGHLAGSIELVPGRPFDVRLELPPDVERGRPVGVVLRSSDHVYLGSDLRTCAAAKLERIALEP